MYVYSVEAFERNITDNEVKEAYFNGKDVQRYSFDEFFDSLNDELINLDTHWVRTIDDNKDYYPISSLHLDDLEHLGFDVSKIAENDMITLANKLSNDYCEQLFWGSLEILAETIGIPRKNKAKN